LVDSDPKTIDDAQNLAKKDGEDITYDYFVCLKQNDVIFDLDAKDAVNLIY